MKLAAAITGDLRKIMAEEVKAAEDAVTAAMRQAADGLKADLRRQVTEAGMGHRLANTWRAELYPKGRKSIKAAGESVIFLTHFDFPSEYRSKMHGFGGMTGRSRYAQSQPKCCRPVCQVQKERVNVF